MDRRKAERYAVSLRCFVSYAASAGEHLIGSIENLSRLGLLVRCGIEPAGFVLPRIGEEIEVDVELPLQHPHLRKRSLHCYATIVRHSHGQNGDKYFAACISELHFRDLPLKFFIADGVVTQMVSQVI